MRWNILSGFVVQYCDLAVGILYLAVNEVRDRSDGYDGSGTLLPNQLHLADGAAVCKLKYL